jgi:hypothetical protein
MRHQIKVSRVAAQTLITQMIYLLFTGDKTKVVCVGNDVDSYCLAIQTHASIATTTAST